MSYLLRNAELSDAEAILRIYSYYIEKTIITFELTTPSIEEFRERMRAIMAKYPYLVATKNGEVVGYAYATAFKERLAYRWSVESTIYLKDGLTGTGLGRTLYEALLKELKSRHFSNVVGVIALPNDPSVALHEKLGFKQVGHFPKIGYKFNQWWDVGYYQLEWEKPLTPPEILLPPAEVK